MPSMKLLLLPAIPVAIAVIAIVADDGKPSAPKHETRHHVRHVDRDLDRDSAIATTTASSMSSRLRQSPSPARTPPRPRDVTECRARRLSARMR